MMDETLLQAGLDWLYRDQRTVKTPCTTHCRHNKLRAGDYLTVCVCFLLLCTGGMSAPMGKPLWENPCGNKHLRSDSSDQRPPAEILEPLLIASKNALTKAHQFSEQWVGKIFQSSVMDHHKEWSHASSDWLPSNEELPKSFGNRLSHEILQEIIKKPLDNTLKLVHRNMQIYAVGLEQAYNDQDKFEDGWSAQFRQMQIENKQVLCELETALMELKDDSELETVQRDVMAHQFREKNNLTQRILRDWLILRDFMTNLEYLIELCEFVIKVAS